MPGIEIGTWTIEEPAKKLSESQLFNVPKTPKSEFALADDTRQLVAESDFNNSNGKYRSIVKLFMRYEKQTADDPSCAIGTGWLIKPDLLVTAGHCAYDWEHSTGDGLGLGRAIEVRAYIGYNGSKANKGSTAQSRKAVKIVTTGGWLKNGDNHVNDVSFMQLNEPFEEVIPFTFEATPIQGNEILGVVGYPGDKVFDKEPGAQMYEQFKKVNWNLASTADHVLEYTISTAGGQSGSPVLFSSRPGVSIGTHVYGVYNHNAASPIASIANKSTYGTPYSTYLKAFDNSIKLSEIRKIGSITFLEIPVAEFGLNSEFDFFSGLRDAFQIVAPIASTVTSTVAPFLGPIGGTVATLASVAIGAAGKKAESATIGGGTTGKAPVTTSPVKDGLTQRAILAEACLQALGPVQHSTISSSGFSQAIMNHYKTLGKGDFSRVGPTVLPVLFPATLQLQQEALTKKAESGFVPSSTPEELKIKKPNHGEYRPFTQGLLQPAIRKSEESFWGVLPNILTAATTSVDIVSKGLNIVGGLLGKQGESSFGEVSSDRVYNALAKRALLGEATLRALENASADDLAKLDITPSGSGKASESIFTRIQSIVQDIGPCVLKYAPQVIDTLRPVVSSLLAKQGSESFSTPSIKPPIGEVSTSTSGGDGVSFFDKFAGTASGSRTVAVPS